MPTGPMRTRSVAICCTVGFLVMFFTTLLNIPTIIAASDAHFGKGDVIPTPSTIIDVSVATSNIEAAAGLAP